MEKKKIRLGVVRCDTHGYYYSIMLDKCDPMLLLKNNYVVHHYAHNIYDPKIRFVNSFSTDRLGDHRIAGQLLTKGVFDQRKLITHRFRFDEVPKAMELKYSMPANWIKGVIVNKE